MKGPNVPRLPQTVWLGAIAVCILLCLFCLFFASCSKAEPKQDGGFEITGAGASARSGQEQTAEPGGGAELSTAAEPGSGAETPNDLPTVRLQETPDAGRAYLDRFIFIGDSTTYGIGYYYEHGYSDALCPPSQVWTPASGTLALFNYQTATVQYPGADQELTIAEAVSRGKPDLLLLTLGVNGVSTMTEDAFTQAYTTIIQSIQEASPDTKIVLNSIYPVMSTYQYIDQISNEKIRAANGWIENIAAGTGVRFLYSYEAVVGEDGTLRAEYCNGDGIHLSGEGFTKVMEYIRTHEYR